MLDLGLFNSGRRLLRACTVTLLFAALGATHADSSRPKAMEVPRRGELLLGELGCLSCHAAPEAVTARVQPKGAPLLDAAGARLTPQYLRAFLSDPQSVEPRSTMPDVLWHLNDDDRATTVETLVHYLASLGGPLDQGPVGAYAGQLEAGRQLFHEVGCVACHGPLETLWELDQDWASLTEQMRAEARADAAEDDEPHVPPGVWDEEPVALGDLARKTTVEALTRFLVAPQLVRPSGRMPSLSLTGGEARSIALYLLRAQAYGTEREPVEVPGLAYDYFEEVFRGPAAEFGDLTPKRNGVVETIDGLPEHRPDNFGFRFSGLIAIDEEGEYTFSSKSDDGSRIRIDGELVVTNDGLHGATERTGTATLSKGKHTIVVTMFEHTGGASLSVGWEGPSFERQPLPVERLTHVSRAYEPLDNAPFVIDPEKVDAGRSAFVSLGCATCHPVDASPAPSRARPFGELDAEGVPGCLSSTPPLTAPRYALSESDRVALRATVKSLATEERALDAASQLELSLERFRCLACHRRDASGGPHPDRRDFFFIRGGFDLGDEGRIPPHLSDAGYKLTDAWMESVLFDGKVSRPYMATRMPQFGVENIGHLPALFLELDDAPDREESPAFDIAQIEDGRRLVGTDGLGCIQCHTFSGYDSLGIPAVDLAEVTDHINFGWFRRLLLDPISINMNTRMPEFWVEGKSPVSDVLGGDPEPQIVAMWNYLRLGSSMPLPEGLVVPDGNYELVARGEPRLCGVFMAGVSPRTLAVGFPNHTHYAFDVQNSRLAKVWRGRFFNARGTWHARAGELQSPPSADVFDMPPGPAFAILDEEDAPWPAGDSAAAGYRVLGRRLDAERRPLFRYAVGPVEIEELIVPELRAAGSWIVRRFQLRSTERIETLWFRQGGPQGEIVRVVLEQATDGTYVGSFEDAFTW
ncbi:MAG: PA14 domain-containing protein [Planctomycetota bacterium]|nr:PA14 domain-containing protein [Planctomycetota bacterium]